MRARPALITAGLAIATTLLPAPAASAQPLDKGHFHDVYTGDVYDCDGTPAQDGGDVSGSFLVNLRGSSPFPYFGQSVHGTAWTTNLTNGRRYTNVFSGTIRDHSIVDNGDGTITITTLQAGSSRYYDADGNLVLRDPGTLWTAITLDYHGTPGNPDDDTVVPGSFRVVRPSTGHSDLSGRDYCADLRAFTS